MNKIRVATLNILFDDWLRWERLELVVSEIKRLKPDVILLQEVSLKAGVPDRLAKDLPGYCLSICPRHGKDEYLAHIVLSKQKPLNTDRLELSQHRVAQCVKLRFGDQSVNFVNVHAYFNLFRDKPRADHISQIINFAASPSIIAGDFNALPDAKSLKPLDKRFISAYRQVNESEPNKTMPSLLWRGPGIRNKVRSAGLRLHGGGTVDYIFVEKNLKINDCFLAFDQPSSNNLKVYASDHFGLVADILI